MLRHLLYIICGLSLFIGAFSSHAVLKAQSTNMFDGGEIGQVKEYCTCSGGVLIEFKSYVDNQNHEYVYQLGSTMLYSNYNLYNQGGYFLSTHFPYGICMVVVGNSCQSRGNPEGTLIMIGTS